MRVFVSQRERYMEKKEQDRETEREDRNRKKRKKDEEIDFLNRYTDGTKLKERKRAIRILFNNYTNINR